MCSGINTEVCSPSLLCEKASFQSSGGSKHWRKGSLYTSFIFEAKKRGLTCGVLQNTGACNLTHQKACDDPKVLCSVATTSLGQWETSSHFIQYVKEAKKRGFDCGVKTQITDDVKSVIQCSITSVEPCTQKQLCMRATDHAGDWNKFQSVKPYVNEAKKRGITCGVKPLAEETCSSNAKICSDQNLCTIATSSSQKWSLETYNKFYVKEAKKRGLSCGVIGPKPLEPGELPKCENVSSGKCYGELQFAGGQYYVGEIAYPSKRTGLGINVFSNGHYWVGTWNGNNMSKGIKANAKNRAMNKNFYALETDQRRKIQLNLKLLGYYKGKVDGLFGTQTMLAGAKYLARQKGHAYFEKLIADDTSSYFYLDIINHNRTTATATPPTYVSAKFDRSDFLNLSSLKRKQLQYGLKKLGYYSSSIDGAYGPRTEKAVRDYARSKGINSGYPNSVYRRIVSEVTVPSSFAVAKKPSPKRSSSTERSTNNPAVGQAAAAILCTLFGGNAAGCIAGATGSNASNPYGSSPSTSSQPTNSCYSNSGCNWREVCIKKAGRGGQCFDLPSGTNRRSDFKPVQCSQSTAISDCGIGNKCDRTFNICVQR